MLSKQNFHTPYITQIYSGSVQHSTNQEVVVAYDDGDVKTYTASVLQKRLERAARELGVNVQEVGGEFKPDSKKSAKNDQANGYLFNAAAVANLSTGCVSHNATKQHMLKHTPLSPHDIALYQLVLLKSVDDAIVHMPTSSCDTILSLHLHQQRLPFYFPIAPYPPTSTTTTTTLQASPSFSLLSVFCPTVFSHTYPCAYTQKHCTYPCAYTEKQHTYPCAYTEKPKHTCVYILSITHKCLI